MGRGDHGRDAIPGADAGMLCHKCGYDLGGLSISAVCPECGFAISETVALQRMKPERWPAWLRLLCTSYVTGVACLLLLAFLAPLLARSFGRAALGRHSPFADAVNYCGAVVLLLGIALFVAIAQRAHWSTYFILGSGFFLLFAVLPWFGR